VADGERLIPDASARRYVEVVNANSNMPAARPRVTVKNNLPGTPTSPACVPHRNAERFIAMNLQARAREGIAAFRSLGAPQRSLPRFSRGHIEGERARIASRWGRAIGEAASRSIDLTSAALQRIVTRDARRIPAAQRRRLCLGT
jgi:hypothetical protein